MEPAFSLIAEDPGCGARAGLLRTAHGSVETPVFMPVATQGSVKALGQDDVEALGIGAILANSYHLYLRPGAEVVEAAGGLHGFMDYRGAVLTDSGGYQVFSLAGLRTVEEDGVVFQSHHDGSRHALTPESVVRLQARLGSDMWTCLDELVEHPSPEPRVLDALLRTQRWMERSRAAFERELERAAFRPLFFPILQGGLFPALRRRAAEHMAGVPHDGVALGGFSVGEEKALTWAVLAETLAVLPKDKPRYLMGMGAPEDLWNAVRHGVDMMDCVWPTRVARNGLVMTRSGRMNIKNARFRKDFGPLDESCSCPVCRRHSRAYLSHLFRAGELAAHRFLSVHNLHFTLALMREIRESVLMGRFEAARGDFLARYAPAADVEVAAAKL